MESSAQNLQIKTLIKLLDSVTVFDVEQQLISAGVEVLGIGRGKKLSSFAFIDVKESDFEKAAKIIGVKI